MIPRGEKFHCGEFLFIFLRLRHPAQPLQLPQQDPIFLVFLIAHTTEKINQTEITVIIM